jgi:hypothetical protein
MNENFRLHIHEHRAFLIRKAREVTYVASHTLLLEIAIAPETRRPTERINRWTIFADERRTEQRLITQWRLMGERQNQLKRGVYHR